MLVVNLLWVEGDDGGRGGGGREERKPLGLILPDVRRPSSSCWQLTKGNHHHEVATTLDRRSQVRAAHKQTVGSGVLPFHDLILLKG